MSFLQSWIVWALPLALLPILIHLIHKSRHRVVEWGAMMFLLEGARMSRGRQRLREILLLSARTLAILGLIVGIGRPIAGGWVGRMGGQEIDTVVLIVDRSASMAERVDGRPESKLAYGLRTIRGVLDVTEAEDLVVIDAVEPTRAVRIEGPAALDDLTVGEPTASQSDLPSALETATSYLEESEAGRSEIWIISDAQTGDWRPEDGRWAALASALAERPAGVRVRLSTFPSRAPDNLGVRVERVRREVSDADENVVELVLDIVVTRAAAAQGSGDTAVLVPVAVEVGGARSTVDVELVGNEARLQGHRIPIDARTELGFGLVELTADSRPSDDAYWFVYGAKATLETLVVRERDDAGRVVAIAAELPLDPSVEPIARQVAGDDEGFDLAQELTAASLLVWQAPLPEGAAAAAIDAFVADGGYTLFLPPEAPDGRAYRGVSWGSWTTAGLADPVLSPETWRADGDLLRTGADGTPLPVGEVELRRYCSIESKARSAPGAAPDGEAAHLTLAALSGGRRVLVRATSSSGGVYFLSVLPTSDSTNLASQGLVLVALVQRALQAAANERGSELQREAGPADWIDESWRVAAVTGQPSAGLFERSLRAGILTDGQSFVALNRPLSEDESPPQTVSALEELFGGVDVVATETARGQAEPGLLEEVWKVFMLLAVIALIAEALLCITEGSSRAQQKAAAPGGQA